MPTGETVALLIFYSSRQWKSLPSWNPLAPVLVLMYFTYDAHIFRDKQKEVLAIFLRHDMLHVKIFTLRKSARILGVITWFPLDNRNCAMMVTELIALGRCEYAESGAFEYIEHAAVASKEVIPRHLPGCVLRVTTSILEPYVYYDTRTRQLAGLEVRLVQAIAHKLGMHADFLLIEDNRDFRIVSNETGIYAHLFQRYLHLNLNSKHVRAHASAAPQRRE